MIALWLPGVKSWPGMNSGENARQSVEPHAVGAPK